MIKRQGFTLMEVVMAIGLLLIIVLAVLSMFAKGIQSSKRSQQSTIAAWLCQEKMEEVLKRPELREKEEDVFPEPFSHYRFIVEVTDFQSSPQLKRIEVKVSSPEGADVSILSLKSLSL